VVPVLAMVGALEGPVPGNVRRKIGDSRSEKSQVVPRSKAGDDLSEKAAVSGG